MARRSIDDSGAPNIDKFATGARIMSRMRLLKKRARQVATEVCTTPAVVYSWTKGQALPGMTNMARLAVCLGCGIDDLVVMEGDKDGKGIDVDA